MRKVSEGLSRLIPEYSKKWEKYKKNVEHYLVLDFNGEYVDIILPYNIKIVLQNYFKDNTKKTGLSSMIGNVDYKVINKNTLRINLTKNSNLFKRYNFKDLLGEVNLEWMETLDIMGILPAGGGVYSLEIICNELLSNYYLHDENLDTTYLKYFGLYIEDFKSFIMGINEGFHCFFTRDDALANSIEMFIWNKDFLSDIHVNGKDLKLTRYGEHSWEVSNKVLNKRKKDFKKEVLKYI